MPKNKCKKGKGRGFKNGMAVVKGVSASQSQEEDTLSEGSSVATSCGDFNNEDTSNDSVVDLTPLEIVEEKLKEAIEGLTEKNSRYRLACLNVIRKYFLSNWMVEFLENYKETLIDGLEKCLRKGKGLEQALAAEVIAVTAVQLGVIGEEEALFTQFKPYMRTVLLDVSFSLTARSKFAQVLGILAFLGTDDVDEILSCMDAFHAVFRGSFLKGDKSVPVVNPAVSNMHLNALSSWGLLLSICPFVKVHEFSESILPRLPELLTSSNVDLRITDGETLALFYEIMRSEDEGLVIKRLLNEKELVNDLKGLATDGNKHRAKKDRRYQRSSFRDILRAVEGAFPPEDQIRFGSETLYIDSWTTKRQFNALRDLLATGINLHLKENTFLREIFDLGLPLLTGGSDKSSTPSRFHRYVESQRKLVKEYFEVKLRRNISENIFAIKPYLNLEVRQEENFVISELERFIRLYLSTCTFAFHVRECSRARVSAFLKRKTVNPDLPEDFDGKIFTIYLLCRGYEHVYPCGGGNPPVIYQQPVSLMTRPYLNAFSDLSPYVTSAVQLAIKSLMKWYVMLPHLILPFNIQNDVPYCCTMCACGLIKQPLFQNCIKTYPY